MLVVLLAAGMVGGGASFGEVVRVGNRTINAAKVIIVVKRAGKKARKHRHKHHRRVTRVVMHTLTPLQPATPVQPVRPAPPARTPARALGR
jgi:hypothetical protein